jgi:hypothetical protein
MKRSNGVAATFSGHLRLAPEVRSSLKHSRFLREFALRHCKRVRVTPGFKPSWTSHSSRRSPLFITRPMGALAWESSFGRSSAPLGCSVTPWQVPSISPRHSELSFRFTSLQTQCSFGNSRFPAESETKRWASNIAFGVIVGPFFSALRSSCKLYDEVMRCDLHALSHVKTVCIKPLNTTVQSQLIAFLASRNIQEPVEELSSKLLRSIWFIGYKVVNVQESSMS